MALQKSAVKINERKNSYKNEHARAHEVELCYII